MAALVTAERHFWLTLSDIKDRDRVFLLDAPLSPSGLFCDAVGAVVDRHQEAGKQAVAFQRFLPRRSLAQGAACHRPCPPPPRQGRGGKHSSRSGASKPKPDLRTVLQAKRSSANRHWCLWLSVYKDSLLCGRAAFTAVHGARLSSVPSGDWSAKPATYGVTGHSDLQRAPSQFFPPRDVAELRCSQPLRGSLEQQVRPSSAGTPLQGTELAVLITPEACLERLVPLVDYLAAWKLLPNVSWWVLHCRERLQNPVRFSSTSIQRGGFHSGGPRAGSDIGTRSRYSLKEAIEKVPPHERESGFDSWYLIVPKKDGGLRPILDLRQLNHSVSRLKFKMITLK